MNFFTQGIGNVAGTYADYLDALIGNIDDRLLTYVVSATPEIQKGKLTLHFQFNQIPGKLTISMLEEGWEKNQDELEKHREAITNAAKISAGEFSLVDFTKLAFGITPELAEWINQQRSLSYHQELTKPRRRSAYTQYNNDFTNW